MPYAGLPEGAVVFEGLPEGAEIIKEAPRPQPSLFMSESAKKDAEVVAMPGGQAFLIGVGSGLYNTYKGAQQLGAELGEKVGLVSPETVKRITAEGESNRAAISPLLERSRAARTGQFMGEILPTAPIPGGVTGGALRRAATAGATGAAIGAARFVPEGEDRLGPAAMGGALAAGTSLGLSGLSKVGNAITGRVPSNAIETQAEKLGIPLTRGEATGDIGAQKTETLLERLPGWLGGLREWRGNQRQKASDAARAFIGKYVADPLASTTQEMKAANEAHIDTLYDSLRTVAKGTLGKVEAPETKQATQELIKRFPAVFESLQDTRLKRIIADIAGDVQDKTVTSPILGANGQPITRKVTPTFSYDDLVEARKGLGKVITKAIAAKDDTAASILIQAKEGIDADLNTMFAQGGGQAGVLFREANKTFVREKVKFDAIRTVYDKAMGTTGGGEGFSPKRFATALKNFANDPKLGQKYHWTPAEVDEMTGLANVLQVVKRAGQYAENPPTGNRWGPLVVAAEAASSPWKLAAGAATGWIARFLTTTQAGKTLSRAASKVSPTSPVMRRIVDQVYNQAPKWAAEMGQD